MNVLQKYYQLQKKHNVLTDFNAAAVTSVSLTHIDSSLLYPLHKTKHSFLPCINNKENDMGHTANVLNSGDLLLMNYMMTPYDIPSFFFFPLLAPLQKHHSSIHHLTSSCFFPLHLQSPAILFKKPCSLPAVALFAIV